MSPNPPHTVTWPRLADSTTDPRPPRRAGLGKADRQIYTALLDAELIAPTRVWWNQVCGTRPHWIDQIPDPVRRRWIEATYCKRPDVMFEQDGALIVAELKPYASYVALGQAIMYERLAQARVHPPRVVHGAILTDQADPDLHAVHTDDDPFLIELGRPVAGRPDRQT